MASPKRTITLRPPMAQESTETVGIKRLSMIPLSVQVRDRFNRIKAEMKEAKIPANNCDQALIALMDKWEGKK